MSYSRKRKRLRGKIKQTIMRTAVSGLIMGIVLLLFVLVLGTSQQSEEDSQHSSFGDKLLSEEVKEYKSAVYAELAKHGKEQYIDIALALMMQESGGRGNDPMQASESLCGERGCIDDPALSIEQGMSHFSRIIDEADGDVKLALQAYNFGSGFIDFVDKNGGEYTEELALAYSRKKYAELASDINFRCIREISKEKNACYGDIKYVDAVLAYYEDAKEYTEEDYLLSLEE